MIPVHALELVNAIRATGEKLSSKDNGFLAAVSIQARQGRMLTDKQSKYLQDIYAKVTGGGIQQPRQRI